MKLLITGGTGFFGRALLRFMASGSKDPRLSAYTQVTVVTRYPERFRNQYSELANLPWLTLCKGDVTQLDTLQDLFLEGSFDDVLHAATDSTDAAQMTSMQQLDQIVNGTRNLLELSARHGCKRFLLTSSGGVYGPQPPNMTEIPETYLGAPDPLLGSSTYGLGKRLAEHLCGIYARETEMVVVLARCFAFVGQDLPIDAHFAIGNFIRDALYRDSICVRGDGSPLRSYMDQRDLARWLLVLLQNGKRGEAYNVGSDNALSIAELASLVRNIVAPKKEVRIQGQQDAVSSERNRYIPSTDKVRSQFGLNISISIDQAIRDAAVVHKTMVDSFYAI